ncbi:MAG: ABC transporter substrate-binding protein [Halanaerobiaceae bacterium]
MKFFNSAKILLLSILILTFLTFPSLAEELQLVSERGTHTEAWMMHMDDFEEETGIELSMTQYPYADYLNQLTLNFSGGEENFDVQYISMLWYPSFTKGDYLMPLNDLVDENPEFKEDFMGLENAYSNENLYVIPYMNELGGVIYRKDLFNDPDEQKSFKEEYGYELQPPETLKQYKDVAEFFHRPPELYGVSMMGKKSIFLGTHFMQRLWARDGELLNDNMEPAFNNDKGVEALKEVKEMFEYSSKASRSHDLQDAITEFSSGRSAMGEFWTTSMFQANEDESSQVAGDVGFTGFPRPEEAKDKKRPMLYISWGFSVANSTKNPEKALEFIKYVMETDNLIESAPEGTIPPRKSALEDPDLQSELTWIEDFQKAMENSEPQPMFPLIPEGSTIVEEELVGAISEYMEGNMSAEETLEKADKNIYDLLEENGYYD